jgi:hypothetical protein
LTIYIRHMDGPPSRDRLAVWTYVQHGEEILCGDPSVTDAERAAAGRETLAGRWQAVLPGNRSRAAAQYSTDVSPPARKRGPAHAQKFHPLCTFG